MENYFSIQLCDWWKNLYPSVHIIDFVTIISELDSRVSENLFLVNSIQMAERSIGEKSFSVLSLYQ